MGHQLADGNGFFTITCELGDVSVYRFLQIYFPAFDQQQHGRCAGHDLRQRGGIEDCILRHRLDSRSQGPMTVRFVVALTLVFDPQHTSGTPLFRDCFFNRCVHLCQFVWPKYRGGGKKERGMNKEATKERSCNYGTPEFSQVGSHGDVEFADWNSPRGSR